jgi:hypothetical protein
LEHYFMACRILIRATLEHLGDTNKNVRSA